MTHEQRERIRELFLAACKKDSQERAEFLQRACSGDNLVRREVESLLASDDEADTFLQTPALGKTFADAHPESLLAETSSAAAEGRASSLDANAARSRVCPERIGQYKILNIIGEGGMGVVYRAQQESPRRSVALKVIKPGVESREAMKRFEHEGQVLGRLQHPGIAQVFEAGWADTEQGSQPFFAMELVHGQPLTKYAETHQLDVSQRLELIAKVCDAVHHAHQKGVIHRDLKPGNILVDGNGQPRILDFGVARATDADIRTTTLQTAVGQLVGTIAYMSPEQIAGDSRELDTRSDVYAMGVIAYELLTGRLPVDVSEKTIPQAARAIVEEEPTQLRSIDRVFRGDVETIILKALEKDKDRRYQSASDLAADIRRYLSSQPISARPATTTYQLRKFAQRNKPLVSGVLVAFAALVIGIAGTTSQAIRATRERNRALCAEQLAEDRREEAETQRTEAQRQASIAQAINDFLNDDLLAAVNPIKMKGRDVTVLDVVDEASKSIGEQFTDQPLVEAAIRLTLGNTYMSLGQYEPAEAHLDRAVALHREQLGEDHAETFAARTTLGYLYMYQARYDDAEPLFIDLLERQQPLLGEDARETLATKGVLGVLYKRRGHYGEAESLYRQVLDGRLRTLGEEHRDTIVSMMNLAILCRVQHRYDEAEPLYVRALDLSRRVQGAEHPDTLNLINNLAVLYKRQGRLEEAESLYLEVVEAKHRTLGEHHPDTLLSLNNLATLYIRLQRYDEAETLTRKVIDAQRQTLGREHPETLRSVHELGTIYVFTADYARAEPLYVEVLDARRRVLDEDHPDTVDSIACLGSLYGRQGRHAEAEPLYREALAKRRAGMGADNRYTLSTMRALVKTLIALDKLADAEPLATECYDLHKSTYGPAHPKTREVVESLVDLYTRSDNPTQTAKWRAMLPESGGARLRPTGEGSPIAPWCRRVGFATLRWRSFQTMHYDD